MSNIFYSEGPSSAILGEGRIIGVRLRKMADRWEFEMRLQTVCREVGRQLANLADEFDNDCLDSPGGLLPSSTWSIRGIQMAASLIANSINRKTSTFVISFFGYVIKRWIYFNTFGSTLSSSSSTNNNNNHCHSSSSFHSSSISSRSLDKFISYAHQQQNNRTTTTTSITSSDEDVADCCSNHSQVDSQQLPSSSSILTTAIDNVDDDDEVFFDADHNQNCCLNNDNENLLVDDVVGCGRNHYDGDNDDGTRWYQMGHPLTLLNSPTTTARRRSRTM